MDKAVNGAAVRGEIEGISVGVVEEPEQVVSELSRHLVNINPNRGGREGMRVERLVDPDEIIKFADGVGGGGISNSSIVGKRRGGIVGEEFGEGGDEGVIDVGVEGEEDWGSRRKGGGGGE